MGADGDGDDDGDGDGEGDGKAQPIENIFLSILLKLRELFLH